MSKQVLGRGAAYIYAQVIFSAFSSYFFWLILTQLTSTSIVGTLAVIISISEILTTIASIGIPDTIQRFLGKTFSERKIEDSKVYLSSSLFFISIGVIASSLFILLGGSLLGLIEIDWNLKLVIILIMGSSTIQSLLNSIVISSLNTRALPIINIIASFTKISLSIVVLINGGGATALAISYVLVYNIVSLILLGLVTKNLFKSAPKKELKPRISFGHASKEILIGGAANWVPSLVSIVGIQLGTILIFGLKGSSDTAVYYLTLNIVSAILLSTTSLFTIALPALSSMQDGRKNLAWKTIRWSSLITLPLSSSLVLYSKDIMKLFGENYVSGDLSLQILLLSILPIIIASGVANFVFSRGNYKQSIAIDLAMNVPRTGLYFILIPIYGIIGGAISFAAGSLLALVVSVFIISKIRLFLHWKDLVLPLIIPLVIGYILYSLQVNYVGGIPITIIISYLLLLKFHIITASDVHDILSMLPSSISKPISGILKKFRN